MTQLPEEINIDILLPKDIAREWGCMLFAPDVTPVGKERRLACFHKDKDGYITSWVSISSGCRFDGQQASGEGAFLSIGVAIPNTDHTKVEKRVDMDISIVCTVK
ncbi:MAG: hypothetical protein KGH64_06230 [Candidatus Micrarchaeota archaeon]|nr:hypothetical protein [Candidatus Micrarchaeota archaeon]